jgi:hypothetical protein
MSELICDFRFAICDFPGGFRMRKDLTVIFRTRISRLYELRK